MSVSNNQDANAATFNAAFVSKDTDSTVQAVVTLNAPGGGSGPQVSDVQADINTLKDDVGGLSTRMDDIETDASSFATKTGVEQLTNKDFQGGTASDQSRIVLPTNTTSNLDTLTDIEGSLAYDTDQARPVFNNGSQWVPVGSGSGNGGGINYISNGDAEINTNGWATYIDTGGQAYPDDGTGGGTPTNVTWTRSTSTPLRGSADFRFNQTGGGAQDGRGVSYDFSIDPADQAKVLTISFDYKVLSGTYSDGHIRVYIYDVTNGKLIEPTNYQLLNSSINATHASTFQTAPNSTSYRLIFHVAKPDSVTFEIAFDNMRVGPQSVIHGSTDVYLGQLTTTGSWSTNTSYVGKYWQRGDKLLADVAIALAGTPTNATLSLNLPNGLSIDTNKLPDTINAVRGSGYTFDLGSNRVDLAVTYSSATALDLWYKTANTTNVELRLMSQTQPLTWASGDKINVQYEVPIAGWSSGQQISTPYSGRFLGARIYLNGDQTISTVNPTLVAFNEVSFDSAGMVDLANSRINILESGYYLVGMGARVRNLTADDGFTLNVRLNGSSTLFRISDANNKAGNPYSKTDVHYLTAGSYIDLIADSSTDNSYIVSDNSIDTFLSAVKWMSPEQLVAGEPIFVQAETIAGQSIGTSATDVVFGTVHRNSHGTAVYNPSTGVFTAPRPDIYTFAVFSQTVAVNLSASQSYSCDLTLSSAPTRVRLGLDKGTGSSIAAGVSGSASVYMSAGMTAKIQCTSSVATTLNTNDGLNVLTIRSGW